VSEDIDFYGGYRMVTRPIRIATPPTAGRTAGSGGGTSVRNGLALVDEDQRAAFHVTDTGCGVTEWD
jgi:hypothetical protein